MKLNVEMRESNKAVPCAYTVMPTLDDIIHDIIHRVFAPGHEPWLSLVGIEREQL